MNSQKPKRNKFFIKGNFQLSFIIIFISLLFTQILITGLFFLKLTGAAIEEAAFKSHIAIHTSAQIIRPIIIKVNAAAVLTSIFIASIALIIIYIKRHILFTKIITGLEHLKKSDTSFRITLYGGKNTRGLIKKFNQTSDALDQRKNNLLKTLNYLIIEEDLNRIEELHRKIRI